MALSIRAPDAVGFMALSLDFATKPALAQHMLARALDAGVAATWVTKESAGWEVLSRCPSQFRTFPCACVPMPISAA